MTRLEFTAQIRDAAIQRANGVCQTCGMPFAGKKIEVDHLLPLALGGKSELANAVALCKSCHATKTAKEDVPRIRKADRQRRAHNGAELPKQPIAARPKPAKPPNGKLPVPPRKRDAFGRMANG